MSQFSYLQRRYTQKIAGTGIARATRARST